MNTLKRFSRAIETRHLPPTNLRGARIKAIDGKRNITISYDYGLSGPELHFTAVLALCQKYQYLWGPNWGYTQLETSRGYLFFDEI